MLKHGILGLLNYHDMTGYEIMEVFRDSLRFFWNAKTSQIYRELQGLENKKWVSGTLVEQTGKPDKKVYSITEEGKKELLLWLADGNAGFTQRVPLLMKTFFLGERSRAENIAYFKGIIAYCETFLHHLAAAWPSIDAYGDYLEDKEKTLYWKMTVDYGYRNMQMCRDWAKSCVKQLEGLPEDADR